MAVIIQADSQSGVTVGAEHDSYEYSKTVNPQAISGQIQLSYWLSETPVCKTSWKAWSVAGGGIGHPCKTKMMTFSVAERTLYAVSATRDIENRPPRSALTLSGRCITRNLASERGELLCEIPQTPGLLAPVSPRYEPRASDTATDSQQTSLQPLLFCDLYRTGRDTRYSQGLQ